MVGYSGILSEFDSLEWFVTKYENLLTFSRILKDYPVLNDTQK